MSLSYFTPSPVFAGHKKQAECLSVVFAQVFVVHLMGQTNGFDIRMVQPGEPLESPVNDDIMYKKIGGAISHDPKACRLQQIIAIQRAPKDGQETWDSEY
jgi:hypothetical protein